MASIPGIGPITASALVATVPDVGVFRSGRQFAAWLGLTPKANSSGGRERQGGITKQGDCYLRRLLVVGATAVIRARRRNDRLGGWLGRLLDRKQAKVAAVALANKMARIAPRSLRDELQPSICGLNMTGCPFSCSGAWRLRVA